MISSPEKCGICGRAQEMRERESYQGFTLWECSFCHGQFWDPMKSPGAEWYSNDERYSFRNLNPLRRPERNHKRFFKDMPVRGGRILDIGMGTGNFLAAAERCGYKAYGIDFDADAISSAHNVFGLKDVYALDLDGALARFGGKFFDVTTMFEVLEHLETPGVFIEKVKPLLMDNGYLAISVPYRGLLDSLKPFDKPPRHLSRWNETAIRHFLELHGFSVIRVKIISITVPFLITKFHFWFRKWTSFNLVEKSSRASGASAVHNAPSVKTLWIQRLARLKDYILFAIPASFFYFFLVFSGKHGLGLYVLARKAQARNA